MMHSLLELKTCQPPPMQLRPGRPMVVVALAQQEARQLLSRLAQAAYRRLTCTNDDADRFMGLIRNPDRGQFAGAVSLARLITSRRSVLIRSPGFRGINDGATTAQSCSMPASCR